VGLLILSLDIICFSGRNFWVKHLKCLLISRLDAKKIQSEGGEECDVNGCELPRNGRRGRNQSQCCQRVTITTTKRVTESTKIKMFIK